MSARKLLRLSHQSLVGCEGVESCGQLSSPVSHRISGSWQQSAGSLCHNEIKQFYFVNCEDLIPKYHVPF